jgi:hypothetical protein
MDTYSSFLGHRKSFIPPLFASILIAAISIFAWAEALPVRHTEGTMHGFLVMQTVDGKTIADGEVLQHTEGERVISQMMFHFRDGSSYEDVTTFTQRGQFRVLNDHLKQQGPSFKTSLESRIDASTGQVTVHYKDDSGQDKFLSEKLDMPPDLANGILPILVKNIQPGVPHTVSLITTTPKPRIVKVEITAQGQDKVSIGDSSRKATRYDLKIVIGGITGAIAKLVGKQPPDTHVWILPGEVPALLKAEGPLYDSGPIWQIKMVAPAWPKN